MTKGLLAKGDFRLAAHTQIAFRINDGQSLLGRLCFLADTPTTSSSWPLFGSRCVSQFDWCSCT